MFRKILVATVAAITLISGTVSAAPTGQYTRVGYIEDVDREGGFTVLVDRTGHVWFWEGVSYQTKRGRRFLKTGSRVVICLDGQGTREVTDDTVVDFEIYR
jgi:hypothetical protein